MEGQLSFSTQMFHVAHVASELLRNGILSFLYIIDLSPKKRKVVFLCLKKKQESEHSLTSYTKIISTWIKILTVMEDTIKLLEGNIGRTL